MGNIFAADPTSKLLAEEFGAGAKDLGIKGLTVGQDTVRQGATVVDNFAGRAIGSVRQLGDEFLVLADNFQDQALTVFDKTSSQFFNTLQMSAVLTLGTMSLFLVLYGDELFKNGIRLGKVNLL